MTRYVLDTDHVSLAHWGHPQIAARIVKTLPGELAVTIVTAQEQVQGRLAQIQQARGEKEWVLAYRLFREALLFYRTLPVLDFDERATTIFSDLRKQNTRIGTLDLRIAAIVLANGSILVTRNRRDFERVPGLEIEDWSV